jgi:hypothetical protein
MCSSHYKNVTLSGEAQFSETITGVQIRSDYDEAFEWKTLQNSKENLYYYYYYCTVHERFAIDKHFETPLVNDV